jgi:hypothetical protein
MVLTKTAGLTGLTNSYWGYLIGYDIAQVILNGWLNRLFSLHLKLVAWDYVEL